MYCIKTGYFGDLAGLFVEMESSNCCRIETMEWVRINDVIFTASNLQHVQTESRVICIHVYRRAERGYFGDLAGFFVENGELELLPYLDYGMGENN